MIKYIAQVLVVLVLVLGVKVGEVRAVDPCTGGFVAGFNYASANANACWYQSNGYSCSFSTDYFTSAYWTCSKTLAGTYGASQSGWYTLVGYYSGGGTDTHTDWSPVSYNKGSPFIYLHNAPEGDISIKLSSALNSYTSIPAFTNTNEWNVESYKGSLSVADTKVDNLFYELALKKITLNRNGLNFTSKDAVIDYLQTSDFLTKLGFSEEEKTNSLGYIIPKIQHETKAPYYYLSILDNESIATISTLNIVPTPNRIDRQHFAVYPTDVPVHTEGEFIFPVTEKENGFTVKETGEFLINPSMFVFFK